MSFEAQLESAFLRRIKFKLNEFEEELWGERGDNRYGSKEEVEDLATKICQRRRRHNCRGTVWLFCGLPGVGCTSVLEETRKQLEGKDILSRVLFVEVLQTRTRTQNGTNRISRGEYSKYVNGSNYCCLFTSSDGCKGIVPLEIILFLAEGCDRTVVLSGPPELYTTLTEAIPRCDIGVIVITCPQVVIGERYTDDALPVSPTMNANMSFRGGESFRSPLFIRTGSFLSEGLVSPTSDLVSPSSDRNFSGMSFRRYELDLDSISSDVIQYISNAGVLFSAALKLVDIINGVC